VAKSNFLDHTYVYGKTVPKEEIEEEQFEGDDQIEIDKESNQEEETSTASDNEKELIPTEQPESNDKNEEVIKGSKPVNSEKIKRLREVYSEEENSKLTKLFGNEVPKGFHKDLNLAAIIKALVYLTKVGYDTETAEENLVESHTYSQLSPVYLNGKKFTIMARSAKSGLLHIQVNAWDRLDQTDIKLFVTTGNNESNYYLFESKEEILKISNTQYQLFRVEAESNVSTTKAVLDGSFEKDKIWLLFKMKDSVEFNSIFSKIREQEASPSDISQDMEGHY
jgi:hypothetical protein